MISNEEVRQLYQHAHEIRKQHGYLDKEVVEPQFFRGRADYGWGDDHKGGCHRHMFIFNNYNAIPEYCFDCYKILINPRDIIEQFKLMMVFVKINLPQDNCRKVLVEMRPNVSGTYKGIINCRSSEEAMKVAGFIQKILDEQVSPGIPVMVKRGCTEYAIAYPEYAKAEGSGSSMDYRPEWKKIEAEVDKGNTFPERPDKDFYNRSGFTLKYANIMYYWLQYASAIGDETYLKVTDEEVPPLPGVLPPESRDLK